MKQNWEPSNKFAIEICTFFPWKSWHLFLSYNFIIDLVGWLFCFTAYQPFSGDLTQNQTLKDSV